ncbi:tRNA preQ1(34) S-adenosylmethionine ribosyltransferase-isomerase QueA [Ferribacterium limneticum]|uniref:tRNA preQ1(34) S-adenosylmethionine ribosyltransferase-isomerase QueA n=1 Tax=Ferribacterium limneticum TaxID=76259 RepID=UPI001CFA84D5|nr:tRNA preQ1(34) S-adenosylmethionine ribosyltransferase-isomerase QueA [Ferribacterium limneticum]UCV29372.1 tRNA preQ1(34) S-adenosylmethionine ribosyltransferase-isomerase QueA [Ferribacterium limneticum]UCV33291.1 tRNA preQ1(34) S-adenosylmethionine ribosyltransferase-isomerase QueA [Ferribacterium limneticum]
MSLTVDDFDFPLPPELIAQHPAAERRGSRLLHVCGEQLVDRQFADLPGLLKAGDLLVFNDTKVIKARFFGQKDTGGQVEIMLERIVDATHAICQVRASKAPKAGSTMRLADAFTVKMTGRAGADGDFFALELLEPGDFWELSERFGKLPLPPYIEHPAEGADETRYQTVYAREPGAVAAPTAGLHFDEAMLDTLRQQGINTAFLTLHVGAGTYRPMRVEKIADHRMHSERFEIPQTTTDAIARTRANGGRVIAVGTTSLRALESAGNPDGTVRVGGAETSIFITPGYRFQVVDRLITNFHLPKSTLLMLVSAFAGYDNIRAAYAHAVAERYRFFSYGDAMLLERSADAA